jgi:hypothetical protein
MKKKNLMTLEIVNEPIPINVDKMGNSYRPLEDDRAVWLEFLLLESMGKIEESLRVRDKYPERMNWDCETFLINEALDEIIREVSEFRREHCSHYPPKSTSPL